MDGGPRFLRQWMKDQGFYDNVWETKVFTTIDGGPKFLRQWMGTWFLRQCMGGQGWGTKVFYANRWWTKVFTPIDGGPRFYLSVKRKSRRSKCRTTNLDYMTRIACPKHVSVA
ncbi:hypothetical protein LOTGIDRAFT_166693 [Lottia gigantea]|uniref:Uncharacterized protein n=1 Tax=Lottia gigantea TaxID=225164 RepID=V4BDV9_LOTGI|nr:hypothetical protein LOTGIDRAFT_166693 [Lottia gigantea]ESO86959.1 hypothetical protein LOTGIDRAFT_166693 [Lottia gigantea]